MILIAGTIRIPAENVAARASAARRMIEATRAEDGCVKYAFAEDVLDPGSSISASFGAIRPRSMRILPRRI